MTALQFESIEEPFRSHPDLAEIALRAAYTAEFLGAAPRLHRGVLNWDFLLAVSNSLDSGKTTLVGLQVKEASTRSWSRGTTEQSTEQITSARQLLERLLAEAEASPRPAGEWQPVLSALDEELVARLVGASPSSIRRYSSGDRETPQAIAERLHFIALVLAELAGSYNDYGMRRWFTRPRSALDGQSPADLMGKDFDPDGPDGERIRRLAESLRSA
jgi:Protein of unknown function (DUF2384)